MGKNRDGHDNFNLNGSDNFSEQQFLEGYDPLLSDHTGKSGDVPLWRNGKEPRNIKMTRNERKIKKSEIHSYDNLVEELDDSEITPWHKRKSINAPHALTPEELMGASRRTPENREQRNDSAKLDGDGKSYDTIPMQHIENAADANAIYSDAAQLLFNRVRQNAPVQQPSERPRRGLSEDSPEYSSDAIGSLYERLRRQAASPQTVGSANAPVRHAEPEPQNSASKIGLTFSGNIQETEPYDATLGLTGYDGKLTYPDHLPETPVGSNSSISGQAPTSTFSDVVKNAFLGDGFETSAKPVKDEPVNPSNETPPILKENPDDFEFDKAAFEDKFRSVTSEHKEIISPYEEPDRTGATETEIGAVNPQNIQGPAPSMPIKPPKANAAASGVSTTEPARFFATPKDEPAKVEPTMDHQPPGDNAEPTEVRKKPAVARAVMSAAARVSKYTSADDEFGATKVIDTAAIVSAASDIAKKAAAYPAPKKSDGRESVQQWEQDFNEKQKQKANKFVLFGDEEEENMPEEMPPVFEHEEPPDEIDDYNSVDDADAIQTDFSVRKQRLWARALSTFGITALLMVLASPISFIPFDSKLYYIVTSLLMLLACIINLNTMRSIASLFTLKADADTASSLAAIAAFVQLGVMLITGTPASFGAANLFAAVACLSLTFNAIGKLSMVSRILNNFELIANDQIKNAATLIGYPYSNSIAKDAVFGDALICSQRKTINVKGFLKHSLSFDPYEVACQKIVPITLAASVVIGILSAVIGKHPSYFVFGLCIALCISAPLTNLLISNFGFSSACRRLRGKGAVLTGFSAINSLSEVNVVTVDAAELFSGDYVKLYSIKTFGEHAIDRAIMDAAALVIESGGPLSDIFDKIIEGRKKILPAVDTVVYEEKMGLTGQVEGRKTIIGNRMVMEAHGIPVPSLEVDRKILRSGRFPVYLASEGVLSALFIVGYSVDENLALSIRRLANTGVTLLVRTCDPNISEDMLADYFGIYRESVSVMSDNAAQFYREVTKPSESEDAKLAVTGGVNGFISGLVASIKLKANISAAMVIHIIGMALGLTLLLFFTLSGKLTMINVFWVAAYQAVCAVFTLAVHIFRRP